MGMEYFTMPYLSRERWISFWYQMMEVTELSPKSVLEIGLGPGILARTFKGMGIKIFTLDINPRLSPDVIGNALSLPLKRNSVDVVLAAEILEHLPYQFFEPAVKELCRVAKTGVVISLPHFHQFAVSIAFKVFPFLPRLCRVWPITIPVKHKFNGQHYWEIGKKGYQLKLLRKLLQGIGGCRLVKDYLIEENPYHHIFILRKDEK